MDKQNLKNIKVKPTINTISDISILDLLKYIYLAGLIIFITYNIIIYFLFKKEILFSSVEIKEQFIITLFMNIKKEVKVDKEVLIYFNKSISSPMIIGLIKPILLLNNTEYEKHHLEMILRHEMIHIKRKDIWYKSLLLLARAIHWFNPLVHLMAKEACRDLELSCDEEVIKLGDNEFKIQYSEAIIAAIHCSKKINPIFSTSFDGGKSMIKKRISNIFDSSKKKKGMITIIVIIAIVSSLGVCFGFSKDNKLETKGITYTNNNLGFQITFPKDWEGRYGIEETNENIRVYSKKIRDNTDFPGEIFAIRKLIGELRTEEDIAQTPWYCKIINKGNGYTYVIETPSDVQYPEDKEKMKEYQSLSQDAENIVKSISLIGNNTPKAKNEGFKLVGSTFFNIEIPITWQIEQVEKLMEWEIKENNINIGRLTFIPYFEEENEISEEYLRSYIKEEFRKIRLEINKKNVDQKTFDLVKSSIKFQGGAYTYVDIQSDAERYIRPGGKRVFGTIEKINFDKVEDYERNIPVSILIKEMKFVKDENEPNGYRIDSSTGKTVEYPIDCPQVLPLSLPNKTNYEMYNLLPMEDYVKKYDTKGCYYEFIVARNGVIKIILERYIP